MRAFMIPIAALGVAAVTPVVAQHRAAPPREEQALRGGAEAVRQAAPMIDRSTDAALDLDVGPLLDALHPYSPRGRHMTLRQMARQDLLYMGLSAHDYLMEQRAVAGPALRRAIDRVWAQIRKDAW